MGLGKKILASPINIIFWSNNNPAETMLLLVFVFSFCPFFMHIGSPGMLGGLITFFACVAEKYIFKYEKQTKLYGILIVILLAIGVIVLFIRDDKNEWQPIGDFLSTYSGAFFGIMIAHLIISFTEYELDKKRKQEEIDCKIIEKQNEQRVIFQKEQEGFVAIKKDGKLIGYIEKEKYYAFVNDNIFK